MYKTRFLTYYASTLHFECNGVDANKDYMVINSDLGDTQNGGQGQICVHAREWVLKGVMRAKKQEILDSEKCIPLENSLFPQPQEYRPVDIPGETRKYITKAYLVGAGTYVLDENDVISAGGINDLENQKDVFQKMSRPSGVNSSRIFYSNSYWDEEKKKSFYWEQRIFGETIPRLLLLTDKPALVLRSALKNTESSALLVSNPTLKWNLVEKDFSTDKWNVVPLDWKESDGPQSIKIGYAEAIPFEFHILPTEEMRQPLLVSPETKSKE
ncbi:MAG: hypothetical protein LBV12_12580 [Puniceicoccales bacterium]|nr:hypothetical protein [Puniceicoccales bacterium]